MSELGTRIKRYEAASNFKLTPRSCLFIRVDGKAFHTFTKGCEKPFDQKLIDSMVEAAKETAKKMQGFKLAYVQSDECTFMLTDFDTLQTQGWFDYEVNKIVSISAAYFSVFFNKAYGSTDAVFDSRAFIVPLDDAPNVFIWRQQDWERNSIQMLAQAHYSQKELQGKKVPDLHELLHQKNINWAHLTDQLKNGTYINSNCGLYYGKMDYYKLKGYFDEQTAS
jgi:tRNA(His) 5'-end guanylyltransferase